MKAIVSLILLSSVTLFAQPKAGSLIGAWERNTADNRITMIISEGYFAAAEYDLANKKFITTSGGKWRMEGSKVMMTIEFDDSLPDNVGSVITLEASLKKNVLKLGDNSFTRVDDGTPGKLAGAWLITGRMTDNGMQKRTPGARKTMKILSGTRFQWIAYNTDTKEFLGTGGGTYTTENGKYVENIEFFSRDNSRVGASLTFDFKLDSGDWHHQGLSSKGDPIHEVWSKRETLE